MASMHPTAERLRAILERQCIEKFGPDYLPAIRATRREAPSISRPSQVFVAKLGRDVHLLSLPERAAGLLASYHPRLFELHEQKMLSVGPHMHPLAGHPRAIGSKLMPVQGTVDVAERLGCLSFHPKVKVPRTAGNDGSMWVPYPYVGDLLLYLDDERGPYCVNWTVKSTFDAFEQPPPRNEPIRNMSAALRRAQARHDIERVYYNDAGIRTVRVAKTAIPDDLTLNLELLIGWHCKPVGMTPDQRAEVIARIQTALELGLPPIGVFSQLMARYRYAHEDLKAVFYQAIWNRQLRVDLFRPILVDRPLRAESRDVLQEFAHWFVRDECTSASN